jgi:membrane peptidoglycan carboxypeptidase
MINEANRANESLIAKCRRPATITLAVICLVAILLTTFVRIQYRQAVATLDGINLRARNVGGTVFYANKKQLFVGQQLSRKEIIEHLEGIHFNQSNESGQPGTYKLEGPNALQITPRIAEFQPVTITFTKNRIAKLTVTATEFIQTSGELKETAIEPETLGAFITTIKDRPTAPMFVRRHTVQPADIVDTDLFFAILASEDATFMSHNGVRYGSLLASLFKQLLGKRRGGSTLTAQVVKNAVSLDASQRYTRKLDELFMSVALERKMSKGEILALYVNDVYLGNPKNSVSLYGFLAAAEMYFGKSELKDLTLNEACILVAMLPKPQAFVNDAEQSNYGDLIEYRNRVLDRLNANWPEKYSSDVIETTKREPVQLNLRSTFTEQPMDVVSRGFVDYASLQQPLVEMKNLPPTEYSGLHVYCSVDPDLMKEGQRILTQQLPDIERRFPPIEKGTCNGKDDRLLGTIIALDPRNGEIVAMVGGAGGRDGVQFSKLALNAVGAPASTVKPFWVTEALTEVRLPDGTRYTAASNIDPKNAQIDGWSPRVGTGKVGRVRTLLSRSSDDFAAYTVSRIGLTDSANFYEALTGVKVAQPHGQLSIGFGSGTEVSPLALGLAYSIFSTNGNLPETSPISRVYLDGVDQEINRKSLKAVADENASFITAQMLRSVVGYGPDGKVGTARSAFRRAGISPDAQLGGKTGSGPNDVWMISVSPRLVVVVWLGYQCHTQIRNYERLYAADTAALLWAEFMKSVSRFRPQLLAGEFRQPSGVVEVSIDPARGCLSQQPNGMREFFIRGTEPLPCDRKRTSH